MEVAEHAERLQYFKDEEACKKHRDVQAQEEHDNFQGKIKAQEDMIKKGSVDGNAYAASLPDKHLSTKAETWEWKTGAVKGF